MSQKSNLALKINQLIILALIPFWSLAIYLGIENYQTYSDQTRIQRYNNIISALGQLVDATLAERHWTIYNHDIEEQNEQLTRALLETDKLIAKSTELFVSKDAGTPIKSKFDSYIFTINKARNFGSSRNPDALEHHESKVTKTYEAALQNLSAASTILAQSASSPTIKSKLRSQTMFDTLKNNSYLFRGVLSDAARLDQPLQAEARWYISQLKHNITSELTAPRFDLEESSLKLFRGITLTEEWKSTIYSFSIIMNLSSQGSYGIDHRKVNRNLASLTNLLKQLSDMERSILQTLSRENLNSTKEKLVINIIVPIVITLLILAFSKSYLKKLASPIQTATEVLKKVCDGKLDQKVHISSTDEMGDLAHAINFTIDTLRVAADHDRVNWNDLASKREQDKKNLAEFEQIKQNQERMKEVAEIKTREAIDFQRTAEESLALARKAENQARSEKSRGDKAEREVEKLNKLLDEATSRAIAAEELVEEERNRAKIEQQTAHEEKEKVLRAESTTKKAKQRAEDLAANAKMEAEILHQRAKSLLKVISHAAKGDLTKEIGVVDEDEMGKVGRALQKFFRYLSKTIANLDLNSKKIVEASGVIQNQSSLVDQCADDTNRDATIVSSAAEEVAASMQHVANGAKQLQLAINEIGKNTESAAQMGGQAVELGIEANTVIEELFNRSNEIGDVIKVINSIASQTNLLALNATIESARAGEAGRGFAVVANEVKELANQTAAATDEIQNKISAIQTNTRQAVARMQRVGKIIDEFNMISTLIASAVEQQSSVTSEIVVTIAEAGHGSTEIAKNISNVTLSARKTLKATQTSKESAKELYRVAETLTEIVDHFEVLPENDADRDDSNEWAA